MSKKQLIVAFVSALLLVGTAIAAESEIIRGVSVMPKKFMFDNKEYVIDYDFNLARHITIKYDFDGDKNIETLVGFQGQTNDDDKSLVSFIVLGNESNGKFKGVIHKIIGNDRFDNIELEDIDKDGLSEIIFWSAGGAHYTSIDIYKYTKGEMKLMFSNGSACGVETQKNPFTIKIYREDFNNPKWCYAMETNKYEIWQWDGKRLDCNKVLSTAKLMTEEEAQEESYNKIYMRE